MFTTAQDPRRLELQALLEELLGSSNVYFQPPPSVQMMYPAIVYQRDAADTKFANDLPYSFTKRYQVTAIDRDPNTELVDRLADLPRCSYQRFFAANGLNHDVFTLYF